MAELICTVSITDTEVFKKMLSVLEDSTIALQRIAEWDELSLEQRVDIGAQGQRDYYRKIAMDALQNIKNLA